MTAAIKNIARRIALLAAVFGLVSAAAVLAGEEPGTTFAWRGGWGGHHNSGGSFNLRIDSASTYNGVAVPSATWALKDLVPGVDKFFNLGDVKPGDRGEATISFHVNKDAWACLDLENLESSENGVNEPESHEDPDGEANGELAEGVEFFAWYDDGDNLFEVGELPLFGTSTQAGSVVLNNKTYALADALYGAALPANQTRYIGVFWCAGDLSVDVADATIGCDGEALGNEAQTDSFSVDLAFRAVPKKDNPHFTCKKQGTQCLYPGPVKVNVQNNATIINHTSSSANTGGNSAGAGGTVITGNASSNSNTTNIINTTTITTGSSGALPTTDFIRNLLRRR